LLTAEAVDFTIAGPTEDSLGTLGTTGGGKIGLEAIGFKLGNGSAIMILGR